MPPAEHHYALVHIFRSLAIISHIVVKDAEDRSVAVLIQQALTPSVRLELLPKAVIDIFVTVIENDGTEGCVAAASLAASTALADAGIEMLGLVASCSSVRCTVETRVIFTALIHTFLQSLVGNDVWLDPTEQETSLAEANLVFACIPALGVVTSVWETGRMLPAQAIQVRVSSHSSLLPD